MASVMDPIEAVRKKYESRIFAILERVRLAFLARGYTSASTDEKPTFTDGDEFAWCLTLLPPGVALSANESYPDNAVDVRFEINEEVVHTGSGDGITFSIDIERVGGTIIGGFRPYNYTEQCWVNKNDAEAVEERFKVLENFYHEAAVEALEL